MHLHRLWSALFATALLSLCFHPALFAQSQADLQISGGLEPGDDNINSGDRVTVDVTVFNQGGTDADDCRVGFYLSTDNVYSSNDVFLESEEMDDIDAFDSEDENEQFAVYANTPGSYYLIAYIDYREVVPESNETNNYLIMPITINTGSTGGGGGSGTNAGVDLRLTANIEPEDDTVTVGEEIEVSYEVTNDGQNDAGEFRVGFYLSTDATWDSGDLYLKRDTHDDLESGDSEDDDEDVTIPANQAAGSYYLLVYADDLDSLNDSDPSNNLAALPIAVESVVASTTTLPQPTMQLFPNPVQHSLQVQLEGAELVQLQILNLQGQVLYQQQLSQNAATVDAAAWPSGTYYVRLQTEREVQVQPFVKS